MDKGYFREDVITYLISNEVDPLPEKSPLRTGAASRRLRMVEVGTNEGSFAIAILSIVPDVSLVVVDAFDTIDVGYKNNTPDRAIDQLLPYRPRVMFLITTSADASSMIADKSMDLIFIDGDHAYEGVNDDIALWTPKLRDGGILSGHDYDDSLHPGVVRAVNELVDRTTLTLHLGPDSI